MLNNGKLIEFIDFGDFKVFESAGIQTMIYIMEVSLDNINYNCQYSKIINKKIDPTKAGLFLDKIQSSDFQYFPAIINKKRFIGKALNFIPPSLSKIVDLIQSKQNFSLNDHEVASGIDILQDFVNKNHKPKIDGAEIGDGIFNLSQKEYANLNLTEQEKHIVRP